MDESKKTDNNNSGGSKNAFVIILVFAGILLVLTSFGDDYSAIFFRIFIVFFTVFLLIVLSLSEVLKDKEKVDIDTTPDTQVMNPGEEDVSNRQISPQTKKVRVAAAISGIIGFIIVFIFGYLQAYQENVGANVRWKYLPKPEDSPISEIITDHFVVIVKTESGNDYVARPDICYQYCWEDNINSWVFKEEDSVHNPSCSAKSQPQPLPEEQIVEEFIFRLCKSDDTVRETRIVIANDGGLWVWQHWIYPTSTVINRSISPIGILVILAFALIGSFVYKGAFLPPKE